MQSIVAMDLEALDTPLKDLNKNKTQIVEYAIRDIFFNDVDRSWERKEKTINIVSEKLVSIPELQDRSAYDLAFLIMHITEDLHPLLRKRLENREPPFFVTDSKDTLKLIARNNEFGIDDKELKIEIITINNGFKRKRFEATGGGLNKSRKKKSLESRKKRRKEKKSLKLRRRRRKRNKKKTKKRE
jgi:hypothetical protein